MQKFLIIQTAFIGDVVLATCLIEKLHKYFPGSQIDFMVRAGNESLLVGHPLLHRVFVWEKKKNKMRNLLKLLFDIRKMKYDKVINVQRFAATGVLTAFSGAKETIGFDKNPFSWLFNRKIRHVVSDGKITLHEIERDLELIKDFTDGSIVKPVLYPSPHDFSYVQQFKKGNYLTIAPASIWFTKQYPQEKWIKFIRKAPSSYHIYLLGATSDRPLAEEIRKASFPAQVTNLCGKLTFLQSAALMKDASMNYVNDSAPMHFASAMNAPVTAVYCSTIPAFGFGPLSEKSFIVGIKECLDCRPCGLHGFKACPLGHFRCAYSIGDEQLLETCP